MPRRIGYWLVSGAAVAGLVWAGWPGAPASLATLIASPPFCSPATCANSRPARGSPPRPRKSTRPRIILSGSRSDLPEQPAALTGG